MIKKQQRPIMGIDASFTGCGIAIMDAKGNVILDEVKTRANPSILGRRNRIRTIVNRIEKYAIEHKPRLVVIEGYAYGFQGKRGSSSVYMLGELGGVIRDVLAPHVDTMIEIQPTALKVFACGHGKGSKDDVARGLRKFGPPPFKSDNQSDAFGLLMIGACILKYKKPTAQYQDKAIEQGRRNMRVELDELERLRARAKRAKEKQKKCQS